MAWGADKKCTKVSFVCVSPCVWGSRSVNFNPLTYLPPQGILASEREIERVINTKLSATLKGCCMHFWGMLFLRLLLSQDFFLCQKSSWVPSKGMEERINSRRWHASSSFSSCFAGVWRVNGLSRARAGVNPEKNILIKRYFTGVSLNPLSISPSHTLTHTCTRAGWDLLPLLSIVN